MNTVTIRGQEVNFGSIKTGIGRRLKDKYPATGDFNVAFVAESLKAGGMAEATPEWVDENVDYIAFSDYLTAAFEASGFKVDIPKVADKPGEVLPPVVAAE